MGVKRVQGWELARIYSQADRIERETLRASGDRPPGRTFFAPSPEFLGLFREMVKMLEEREMLELELGVCCLEGHIELEEQGLPINIIAQNPVEYAHMIVHGILRSIQTVPNRCVDLLKPRSPRSWLLWD
jgi:hypothetical protein